MPRREVLSPAQRDQFTEIPATLTERDLARFYTLSDDDLAIIAKRRRKHNRLGFAVQLTYLRFPGRPLEPHEEADPRVVQYVAAQLQIDPARMQQYALHRDSTRREHLRDLITLFGFRDFDRTAYREVATRLLSVALSTDKGMALMSALVDDLRTHKIVMPAISLLERLAWETRRRAERQICRRLTADLTSDQAQALDRLLVVPSDQKQTTLIWLRQAPRKASAGTILKLLERLRFIRALGLSMAGIEQIHQNRVLQLAREGARYTPQALARFDPARRYATLIAFLSETAATLTDLIFDMHDRMMGQYLKRSERAHGDEFRKDGKAINRTVRLYAEVGTALIQARTEERDPYAAIQAVLPWQNFVSSVETADELARPVAFDHLDELDTFFPQLRRYAPLLLETFEFQGGPKTRSLRKALELLHQMNQDERKKIKGDAPTAFVKPRWESHVFTDQGIDRHYYELCAFHELRQALRSGDLWVTGSRQFKALDDYLLSAPTWNQLKETDGVNLGVPLDCETYLAQRTAELHAHLTIVNQLATAEQLPDARLHKDRLSFSPIQKAVPDGVDELQRQLYRAIPWIKITDLLVAIDRATGFSTHFTHLHTGNPPKDKAALFAAILAEATNLGLEKMANACPGMTFQRLAWIADWYLRDDTYTRALAEIINQHHRHPYSAVWGDGSTSSSDGQRFPVAGRRDVPSQITAKYGPTPSAMFYGFISDQYDPFHIKAISTPTQEAPHALDGLLYHETELQIKEHYTDTGGFTEHLFAMYTLLNFRFAPRIRDLGAKRLYLLDDAAAYPKLAPLIGGAIKTKLIREHWDDILRLATSVQKGVVTASLILRKLSAYPKQNGLAVALREMGRIESTLFDLCWMQDVELRRRVTIGLNKGEAKHALARAVCFNRHGAMHDRTLEDLQQRASGLNLVVAAIIHWNTLQLDTVVPQLRASGQEVPDALRRHISPLAWDHILLTGEYHWLV